MIKWGHPSDLNDVPDTWDYADPTKDAGEVNVGFKEDEVLDSMQMGDINIIYKNRSVWGMEFIGAPSIFRFYPIFDDIGLIETGCLISLEDGRHLVISHNDIYVHDGRTRTSIFPQEIAEHIAADITKNLKQLATPRINYIRHMKKLHEIWIVTYGQTTSYTKIWVWNYRYNTYYTRIPDSQNGVIKYDDIAEGDDYQVPSYNATIDQDQLRVLDTKIYAVTINGSGIFELEHSASYQAAYVLKRNVPLGRQTAEGEIKADQRSMKEVYAIYPHIETSANVTATFSISLILSNKLSDEGITTTYEFKSSEEKLDVRGAGRFVGIKFGWPKSSKKIALSGFSVDVDIVGDR
jgi:hypothetical protein